MNAETIITSLKTQAANIDPLGAKIKFVLDEDSIMIDGTGDTNVISASDGEADCVISTTKETFSKLQSGEVNPMMAVMMGQLKIKGDMGLAMKIQSLI